MNVQLKGAEDKAIAQKLAYPNISEIQKIKSATYQIDVSLSDMPKNMVSQTLKIKNCEIYTLIAVGDIEENNLKIISLSNPAATCK